jgi:hypothetical protein
MIKLKAITPKIFTHCAIKNSFVLCTFFLLLENLQSYFIVCGLCNFVMQILVVWVPCYSGMSGGRNILKPAIANPNRLKGQIFEKSSCWGPKCGRFIKILSIFLRQNNISETVDGSRNGCSKSLGKRKSV